MGGRDDDDMADEHDKRFDWFAGSEGPAEQDAGLNGASSGLNGHDRHGLAGYDTERASQQTEADESGWVESGGVLRWEEPDETDNPRNELDSPLAADELDLPPGAPDTARVRSVHAWMLRRRVREHAALGEVLLAQRAQRPDDDDAPSGPGGRRRKRRGESELSPLELEVAEHQAAADEYDVLLATLDEHLAHSGPGRALVEFYLWLGEHLAAMAAEPEAATSGDSPRTLAAAAWLGRAQAALAARGRVERATAPEVDD